MDKINVNHLNFYYGDQIALADTTMAIAEHRITALIGPSGCGKSTFLRCLNRMNDTIRKTRVEGEVLLDGQNIYENPQGPNGQGQTVAMWLIDRNTIFRERATKGVIDERVLYRVSPDGKTLTWTPFNANGDSGQMVWERINLP